jgi:hypothetical protein
VEHLLGAQLGGLGIEPGFLEQRGDLRAGQADQIDLAILARVTGRGTGTGSTWPGIGMDTGSEVGAFMRRPIRIYRKIASRPVAGALISVAASR